MNDQTARSNRSGDEVVILRSWKMTDLDDLVRFANNRNIAGNLTDAFPHPYTESDGIAFLQRFAEDAPPGAGESGIGRVFAIETDGQVCGSIGIFPGTDVHRKNAEVGYWLAEPFWGRGIMTEAVRRIIEFGFKNFDVNRIYARPFGTNKGSQRVLEKAGMKLEACLERAIFKNGAYMDELIFAIHRSGDTP